MSRLAWEGGKCRVPMWTVGAPNGFCDAEAFGEQLPHEMLYQRHYNRQTNRVPYCFGPCCPAHGGPKADEPRLFADGTTEEGRVMWCCVGPDFVNLQESPAGFDGDPFIALANYHAASAIEAATAAKTALAGLAEGESAVAKPDTQAGAA